MMNDLTFHPENIWFDYILPNVCCVILHPLMHQPIFKPDIKFLNVFSVFVFVTLNSDKDFESAQMLLHREQNDKTMSGLTFNQKTFCSMTFNQSVQSIRFIETARHDYN